MRLQVAVRGLAHDQPRFTSSDTSVLMVDSAGKVSAVGVGSAYVIVWLRRSSVRDTARILVPAPPGVWLLLRPESASIAVGRGIRLSWQMGGTTETGVRFRSSDSTIAVVGDSGLVWGCAEGQAVIRANAVADAGASDSTRMVVGPAPPDVVDTPGPTISTYSVVDSAGQPVPRDSVRGTVRVTILIDLPACRRASGVRFVVDNRLWDTWDMTVGVRTHTFTLDTRATDGAGQPLVPNGQHIVAGLLMRGDGIVLATTSFAIVVRNP